MEALGIEIGDLGIRGATVNLATGKLTKERLRLVAHDTRDPREVGESVAEVVDHFGWSGWVGCAVPSVVKEGVVHRPAGLGRRWRGTDAQALLERRCRLPFTIVNEADATGLAEIRFGAGRDRRGVVVVVALDRRVGCAVFNDGVLVPNVDLGRLEMRRRRAEEIVSLTARDRYSWSWKRWAAHLDRFLARVEDVLSPDLFIIGGLAARKAEKFVPLLDRRAEVAVAQVRADPGLIGAALVAG